MMRTHRFGKSSRLLRTTLLAASALSGASSPSAKAADRVLDFSGGCKAYRLENKAWVPTDSAPLEGLELSNAQILKDDKFTVFRSQDGVYGVSQKCVKPGMPGESKPEAEPEPAPAPTEPPQPQQPAKAPTKRRTSAAKPTGEASLFDHRAEWAAAFSLGYDLSPSGTVKTVVSGVTTSAESNYKSSITFIGEASYRVASWFRLSAEVGISQLQSSSTSGNEVSFIALRPEVVLRASPSVEMYFGPTLGRYFLSQNAETTTTGSTTVSLKQQTASASLTGAKLGADIALSEQFDLGFFLSYLKPGSLTVTGTVTAPATASFQSTLDVKYMTLGSRFVIHF